MAGVELLFAPMLIGVLLNSILYGALAVQTYIYFQTYKGDPRWFKTFVAYLLFCETMNTICDIGIIYEPLIIRYGTPRAAIIAPIMLSSDPAWTVLVSLPVQLFIAWRVKVTSKSSIMPTIIGILAIISFLGGVATAVAAAIINEYTKFAIFHPAPVVWLASSATADILITVSLVYNLSRQRTGFAVTDDVINKIIRLTVQTGLLTSVFATLDVIMFLALKASEASLHTTLNFIMDFALSKLYSNSLLSTLNARGGWKATSSIRDNVLFGNGTDGESTTRSRTQIEIVSVDPRTGRASSMVPMKVFDGSPSYDESRSNGPKKFMDSV